MHAARRRLGGAVLNPHTRLYGARPLLVQSRVQSGGESRAPGVVTTIAADSVAAVSAANG
jgi:hypothetical protein